MSSSVKLITDKFHVKLRFNKLSNEVSFATGVHFDAKNSLKSLAFSFTSVTSLLPTFNGCIRGVFSIYKSFEDRPKCLRVFSCITQLLS